MKPSLTAKPDKGCLLLHPEQRQRDRDYALAPHCCCWDRCLSKGLRGSTEAGHTMAWIPRRWVVAADAALAAESPLAVRLSQAVQA